MEDIKFSYNGSTSDDTGVYMVEINGGMRSTPFLAERELITEEVYGNDIPYFFGIKRKPLRFTLYLSCLEGIWTFEKRREVARWLDIGSHKEFYNYSEPSKIYYLMYTGGIDLTYAGDMKGYLQVEMVNFSPYAYSPVMTDDFDLSYQVVNTIDFYNEGDDTLLPYLYIKKVENGSLSIINRHNGGKETRINNLVNGEEITLDCFYREIHSSDPLVNRLNDFNKNYLELPIGKNTLDINGKCILQFKYQLTLKG
jgi:phage-related protein